MIYLKAERERVRLIPEARAIYDSIFPAADPVMEQQDKVPVGHAVGGAKADRSDSSISFTGIGCSPIAC